MNDDIQRKVDDYRKQGYETVLLGLCDIDGLLRGKYVSLDKFASLLEKGGGFCDCVFGWDIDDQLYDAGKYTGWHTGFPDTSYRLLIDTERQNPLTNTPFFLGEFANSDESDHALCPRTLLRNVVKQLEDMGYSVKAGFEYEFFVFNESAQSIREKNYLNLEPFTPGNFGYSVLRASSKATEFTGLLKLCKELDMELEGLHCETGPGVWEAALAPRDVLEAADQATLFKTFSKSYFQQQDRMATFMAKWSMDYPGQSGHFHFSLLDDQGNNVLSEPGTPIGEKAQQVIGGLATYLPEFLSLYAPTVNSYTRLVKGAWAPISSTWGVENRTCAIRWVAKQGNEHVEHRVPGADANPYLVAAGALAACILGLRKGMKPRPPIVGNAYDFGDPPDSLFSTNLRDAADALDRSLDGRKILGDEFVDHFVMTRRWEQQEAQKTVTDWQLRRYFESI